MQLLQQIIFLTAIIYPRTQSDTYPLMYVLIYMKTTVGPVNVRCGQAVTSRHTSSRFDYYLI